MRYIKYFLLFLIPFLISVSLVIFYFKFTEVKDSKITDISNLKLPSISFGDIIKISRFSLDKAPSQSLVGSIASITGDVQYESRIATESSKILTPVNIQQGENLSTGRDGKVVLNFKDGVNISISPSSSISVIQTLPADLVFWQKMGSVSYKKLGNYPVSIRVGHLLVEDDGEVNISFTADSPITTVDVISGSVIVAYNNINNVSRVITVNNGQILKFNEAYKRSTILSR